MGILYVAMVTHHISLFFQTCLCFVEDNGEIVVRIIHREITAVSGELS